MEKHGKFFLGVLGPVFIFVAIVLVIMDAKIFSFWTVLYTLGAALVVTIIEAALSKKPPKKPFKY